MCCSAPAQCFSLLLPPRSTATRRPELPLDPCSCWTPVTAWAHSVCSRVSAPWFWLYLWRGEGACSVSLGDRQESGIRVTFSFPLAPRTAGVRVSLPPHFWQMELEFSESAREQGQLCQSFDTVGCELKPELPDKCSDQEKCLYLTWIHIFHMELISWHIPQALWGSQRLWSLGGCWDNPSPVEAGKRYVS